MKRCTNRHPERKRGPHLHWWITQAILREQYRVREVPRHLRGSGDGAVGAALVRARDDGCRNLLWQNGNLA